ncbi:Dihydrolipoyllysine-residue acetyltransferase component of acetoin cleaving system [Pseudooctadecabacter jejudonensis]|uniref:Dihydrolipoyllysine-residue acetyltransferase component of acetoin cleaving system n=1 Tax=Pseudooctadecabacter jejudonensis TaxID=1391910 RepID=A0A1Y5SX96_9RHOB|nr:Dihydrolipoyllysine-residue acetyltransferase component of acetoin cleaving system [Pseudooctadecabacter jejudonensis]
MTIWIGTYPANSDPMPVIAGHEIWVKQTGQGDPSRVFVHCSLGRGLSLMPLAEAMPKGTNTLFDLPGHGTSAGWTGNDYHSDCLAILEALTTGPTHVIGHSFGATVALRLAIERPERVTRLTLIEPVLFAAAAPEARAAHEHTFAPFTTAWKNGDRESASRLFTSMWGTGPAWHDLPTRNKHRIMDQIHMIPATAPAIEEDVHKLVARLGQIRCPTDLIEGENSQPVMGAILDRLAADIPNAARSQIAGADHMVAITHPAEVAKALARA